MKLANLGHAQSKETRVKIGVGVRIGWERRRQLMMLQETYISEWQNLIAEAAKAGFVDEEELQWDSYKILNQQLKEEWLQSIEERKRTPRSKGSRRAPKSLEQRRKISEAISAKWADPSYRDRVYSGLARYHGISIGVERKPRSKKSDDGQTSKRSPSKKKIDSHVSANSGPKSHIRRSKLNRRAMPLYKDPLVGAKLEMLRNIRAQRAVAESKQSEAVTRAKLLIAEAAKAANALEVAAKKSPIAHASLIESRKLIAEAVQSIMSIEKGEEGSQNDGSNSLDMEDKTMTGTEIMEKDVNGAQSLESSDTNIRGFDFDTSEWQDLLADRENVPASTFNSYNLVNGRENGGTLVLDDTIKLSSFKEPDGVLDDENHSLINGSKSETMVEESELKSPTMTKKWVRGRLVDVTE